MGTVPTDFSGGDVVKVLTGYGYRITSRSGSHVTLREELDTGEVRRTTVPMHDRVSIGTLRGIADDVGANDFENFCRWIDNNR
jgi:predicted RNA binding protein YcfA (HicA-like mRNA interferase family)